MSFFHHMKLYNFSRLSSMRTGCRSCSNSSVERGYIPRRAVLYVPGNDQRKLEKIKTLDADCVVLDCEDGVAINKKEIARKTIRDFLTCNMEYFKNKDCSVRFNGTESGLCFEDMKEILSAPKLPSTVHLPKIENYDQIKLFSENLEAILGSRAAHTKLRLILFIESAQSLLNLNSICQKTKEASYNKPFLLDGLVFGSDDYCADVGLIRTPESTELQFARQYFVTVAKAHKLQAIDMVYIDYKDLIGLERQCQEGTEFGFTGKQVIHPGQLEIVHRIFTPSLDKILWAKELIEAFEQNQKEGKGAFVFRGSMIDRPLLLQAKNLVQFSKSIESK